MTAVGPTPGGGRSGPTHQHGHPERALNRTMTTPTLCLPRKHRRLTSAVWGFSFGVLVVVRTPTRALGTATTPTAIQVH